MSYYDTLDTYRRRELGIDMACYVKRGYTQIVATGGYSDAPTNFDHSAFPEGRIREAELRLALRRHARFVKARNR